MNQNTLYRIVGLQENNNSKTYVQLQLSNTSRSFYVCVEDVYKKDWLDRFSKEDCAYLAVLYVAEKENKPEIISSFPRKKTNITTSVLILSILYSAFLIVSNLAGFKLTTICNITFPTVLVFFPLTYILDDIITEVYGFEVSKKIIWSSLSANLIVVMAACLAVYLPAANFWDDQSAFETVFLASPRILVASTIAYIFGEFLNAISLSKLKILTRGKHLWFRSLTSTFFGSAADSIIFCFIAFYGLVDSNILFEMMFIQYCIKNIYAILALPMIYKLSNFLKKQDKVDFYDYSTKFNPFSVK
ncbi:MAG: hypothetical protein DGJ47_000888 [Rickettsiaceae bacterium]